MNPAALTALRETAGYSKAAFAREVGISRSYLTEIERGIKPGSPDVMKRMASALRCPIAALMAYVVEEQTA